MKTNIEFTDNSAEILELLGEAKLNGLTAIGMTAETYAKKELYPGHGVDTGRLRNSITYAITGETAHVAKYRANRKSKEEKRNKEKRTEYEYEGVFEGEGEGHGEAVYIGTNVEYAEAVEKGTSRMDPIPFLTPAATEHSDEYRRIMKAALESAK